MPVSLSTDLLNERSLSKFRIEQIIEYISLSHRLLKPNMPSKNLYFQLILLPEVD